jgi:hypothetical protein
MARPRVAAVDGLKISRSAANVLNNQSRTAENGWSSISGLGEVLTTGLVRNVTQGLTLGQILWNVQSHCIRASGWLL